MKRITVSLPDDLAALLDQERRRRDVSAATVIRTAVERYLTKEHTDDLPFIGILDSAGIGPHARDLDEFLEHHWEDHIAGNRREPTHRGRADDRLRRQSA